MAKKNPLQSLLDLQRSYINQSRTAFQKAYDQSIQARQNAMDAVEKSLETIQSTQQEGNKLVQSAVSSYFDAIEKSVDQWKSSVQEARNVVEQRMSEFEELDADQWKEAKQRINQTVDSTDELTRHYIELFNQTVDALLDVEKQIGESAVEAAESVQENVAEAVESSKEEVSA